MRIEERGGRRRFVEGAVFAAFVAMSAATGIMLKEGVRAAAPRPMMMVDGPRILAANTPGEPVRVETAALEAAIEPAAEASLAPGLILPEGVGADEVRWFNARPIVPFRKMWMKVTAYSPDARSCGESADGITATLHHVSTNEGKLVAADQRLLPYGAMLSIPGYDDANIVPVLDCGGAIKGHRLDVLFPTHEEAMRWGVRHVQVTVWGYADGKPADNPRELR